MITDRLYYKSVPFVYFAAYFFAFRSTDNTVVHSMENPSIYANTWCKYHMTPTFAHRIHIYKRARLFIYHYFTNTSE